MFGVLVVASGALLLVLGSKLTFLLDDWEFLLARQSWSAHAILSPHGEHITVLPILIYKTLFETVGMSSALPYRVVSTAAFLIGAVLLFAYLRGAVGEWLALLATAPILFLGAAWEDLLWPFQIAYFGSLACGLGMLLALRREDRSGDRLACLLLVVSIAFTDLGLPFAIGAAVDVWQRRESWRSRAYVVVVPLALYALWWLGWGHTGQSALSAHNVLVSPRYLVQAVSAALFSLLGRAPDSFAAPPSALGWRSLVLLAVLALAVWRLRSLPRVPRGFWIVLAIGLSFWLLAAFNVKVGRGPVSSRYQLPGAVFLLLMAAELLRGVRVGPRALTLVAVAAALSIAGNLADLHDGYDFYKSQTDLVRADLGAVEIARGRESPAFFLTPEVADTQFVGIQAGPYLSAAAEHGSPADSEAELTEAPEPARAAADRVLATGLGIGLMPVHGGPGPGAAPGPRLIGPASALAARQRGCLSLRARGNDPPLLELPPGGATVSSSGRGRFEVRLRRFATSELAVDLGPLPPQTTRQIAIPADRSLRSWKLSLDGSGPVTVCGLGPG